MSREAPRTASALGYPNREAVRIKVKKYEDDQEPEYRKFSVDPQITTYSILRCLLSRAFELKGEFAISYMAIDDFGEETFLALLSDWDLDAAFLSASEPYLHLRLEVRPFDLAGQWEPEPGLDVTQLRKPSTELTTEQRGGAQTPAPPGRLLGNVLNQVQNTFSLMSRALNMGDERPSAPLAAPPLTDAEFHNYLDTVGRLVQPKELRVAVYRGGVVPSLRKVVWKHLLNVYPENMTARERIDYVKTKSAEYRELRDFWMKLVQDGKITDEIHQSTNMVKKDVLRTDRHLPFFAGGDDNINVVSLFNILTTYALNHPSVGYCQGMSDLVSPLLYVLQNEAQAYISFCGLMRRLRPNFDLDGLAMTVKFQHLTEALQFYDPEFYDYLKDRQADDLLFCYRWLLLELKREFAFEEALRMLEVLWSSLPPDWPADGLQLFEQRYTGAPPPEPAAASANSPPPTTTAAVTKRPTLGSLRRRPATAYSKVCAMRRQSSGTVSLGNSPLLKKEFSSSEGAATGMAASKRVQSLDGIAGGGRAASVAAAGRTFSEEERQARKEKLLRERRLQSDSELTGGGSGGGRKIRDLAEFRRLTSQMAATSTAAAAAGAGGLTLELEPAGDQAGDPVESPITPATPSDESDYCSIECPAAAEMRRQRERLERSTSCFIQHAANSDEVDIFENPILEEEVEVGSAAAAVPQSATGRPGSPRAAEPVAGTAVSYSTCESAARARLPPPQELGGGNPFLIFLCLSLLQQHRDAVLSRRLDYQEVAMLFDKMVRKHDVSRTLEQARKMFSDYVKRDWSVGSGGESVNGSDVGV